VLKDVIVVAHRLNGGERVNEMPIIRRVNEQTASEWQPIPTGVWRFELNPAPEVEYAERYSSWGVRFPMILVPDERERLARDYEKAPAGMQQSYRTNYKCWSLSLGYFQKSDGQFRSTKLMDFLEACIGHANAKRFHEWILNGGGPIKPEDPEDPDQEIEAFRQWFGWFEGLEVLGSIRHEEDANGTLWARFGGPMAVGSLPNLREDDYQAHGRGKLRSMIAEYEASVEAHKSAPARVADDRRANAFATRERPAVARGVAEPGDRTPTRRRNYDEVFGETDKTDKNDIPF
jgi:hypothetical protein